MAKYLIFITLPVLNLFYGLKKVSTSEGRKMLLLFFIMFGLSFNYQRAGDGRRHAERFKSSVEYDWSKYTNQIIKFINGNPEDADLYTLSVNHLFSRFTSNPSLVFGFHAFVFGFFYLKSVSLLLSGFKLSRDNYNAFFFFFFFFFVCSIWRVSYVRFYTACWILFYFGLKYFNTNSIKYLLLSLTSALVHFSLLPIVFLVLISNLFSLKNTLLIGAIFIAFAISSGNLLNFNIGYDVYDSKLENYTKAEYINARNTNAEERYWYVKYSLSSVKLYLYFCLIYLLRKKFRKGHFSYIQNKLFNISFLTLTLTTVLSYHVAAVERFYILASLFVFALMYRHFNVHRYKSIGFLALIGLVPLSLYGIREIRLVLGYIGPSILGNPILSLLLENPVTFWEILTGGA